jgi:hypothetical protein
MPGGHALKRYPHKKIDGCKHCTNLIERQFVSEFWKLDDALEACTLPPVYRCDICTFSVVAERLQWPRDRIRVAVAKFRDAEMARRAKLEATRVRDTDTDGFDLRLHDGESWFGCALGEANRVCFRSRNTR